MPYPGLSAVDAEGGVAEVVLDLDAGPPLGQDVGVRERRADDEVVTVAVLGAGGATGDLEFDVLDLAGVRVLFRVRGLGLGDAASLEDLAEVLHGQAGRSLELDLAVVQHDGGVAEFLDLAEGVRHEDDRAALLLELADLVEALLLELLVAHGQDLVDEEDVRVGVDRDGEREPDVHARAVELDLRVDELADAAEPEDVVELLLGFLLCETEDRGVEEHVLAAGEVRVEARTEFDERSEAPAPSDRPRAGLEDAADHLEQGRLARSVRPEQSDRRPGRDVEVDVLEGPEVLAVSAPGATERDDPFLEGVVLPDDEALRDVPDADDGRGVLEHGVLGLARGDEVVVDRHVMPFSVPRTQISCAKFPCSRANARWQKKSATSPTTPAITRRRSMWSGYCSGPPAVQKARWKPRMASVTGLFS